MTEYKEGLWYGWNGGERPVHKLSIVDVALLDGITTREVKAGNVRDRLWIDNVVVAFRVVKEHRKPREWWIIPGAPTYPYSLDHYSTAPHLGAVRVREVLDDEERAK